MNKKIMAVVMAALMAMVLYTKKLERGLLNT